MAVVNPGSGAITVTMTVFGADGAQIGTVTLNLAARTGSHSTFAISPAWPG